MKNKFFTFLLMAGLMAVSISYARQAQAALGETVDSIAMDEQSLSAVRGVAKVHKRYTVHEITTDSTTVREFVSPSGVVFGVAWNGLAPPDLKPLLGSYADEYEDALKKTPRKQGRRHAQITGGRVVVQKWGHMRNLQGRAYDPALIPAGVNIHDIK